LASGSKYFLEVFRSSDPAVLTSVDIPLPIKTKSNEGSTVIDEHFSKILRFIYNNQDFGVIKSDINESNVSIIYSQAYIMRCEKLLPMLDDMIVKSILTP
jgi:hypothetical protein